MATTSLIHKITESAHVDDEVGSIRDLLVDKLVAITPYERKPVTIWEVAAKLGYGDTKQALAILDGLTAEGTLIRFRAGFNNYYASPKVALIGKEPSLRAIMSDSLKGLFLSCQYKVTRHLK